MRNSSRKKIYLLSSMLILISITLCACSYLEGCFRGPVTKKPVIYLYPEKEMEISVKLKYNGKLTSTYPKYEDGWLVRATPQGILKNTKDEREYSYLFWEGIPKSTSWDLSSGFVVKGEDSGEFLYDKLKTLGLNERESNDFITYWLPRLEHNKYNLITFQSEAYEKLAKLNIEPEPKSFIRVFMVFKPLSKPIKIEAQQLHSVERNGYTVVEWGGTELK